MITCRRLRRIRNITLVILWCIFLVVYFDRVLIAVALPVFGRELGLTALQKGLAVSAVLAGCALFQALGGMLACKAGSRGALTLALVWWSILTALTGFAGSFIQLCLVRLLFGAGAALHPSAYWNTVYAWFPKGDWAHAGAANLHSAALAPALAPILVVALLRSVGLGGAFCLLALPGLILAWIAWKHLRDEPRDHPAISEEELKEIRAGRDAAAAEGLLRRVSVLAVLALPGLPQLILGFFVFSLAFWGFMAWMPSYLMDARGFSLERMGLTAGIPFLAAFAGMFMALPLCEKLFRGRRRLFLAFCWVLGALFLHKANSAPGETECLTYLSLAAAFGFFMFMRPFWALPAVMLPPWALGPASRLINHGGQIGGIVSPPLIGFLIDAGQGKGPYDAAFALMEICLLLAAVMLLLIRPAKPQ